jgi:hypothetical protein
MVEKKQKKTAPETGTELPGGGNIDNIRDILFGAHMRQYEKRFQRLEELLAKECSDIREELRSRVEALEGFAKQESDALTDRIKSEKDERAGAVADLTRELGSLAKEVERKTGRIEESLGKGLKELRGKILDQSKNVTKEIRDRADAIQSDVDRDVEELRTDKTDRAALSALFTEMAMRLSDELRLPEGEE